MIHINGLHKRYGTHHALRRDFDLLQNDYFGIAIDGLNDGRTSLVFQATPYGSQRDAQVLNGENINEDWNGLWHVVMGTVKCGRRTLRCRI